MGFKSMELMAILSIRFCELHQIIELTNTEEMLKKDADIVYKYLTLPQNISNLGNWESKYHLFLV